MSENLDRQYDTGYNWMTWLLCSLAIILASRINIVVLADDFYVATGVIILSVSFFLAKRMPFIPVVLAGSVGIFLSRVIVTRLMDGVWVTEAYYPELVFYLTFGFLFWIVYRKRREVPEEPWALIPLVGIDCFCNCLELFLRTGANALSLYNFLVIFMIALVRAAIIWALLTTANGHTLIRRELLENYEKVTVLASQLEAEAYWMKENSNQIEDIVQSAYDLYDEMLQEGAEPEKTEKVLRIATGVHEVKKGYAVILRGMEEVLSEKRGTLMTIGEILNLMEHTLVRECEAEGRELQLTKVMDGDVRILDSHGLISVLSNLMINAMEATTEKVVRIRVEMGYTKFGYLSVSVTNYGPEIPKDRLKYIFVPGFSTKVNTNTGATSRGMGLALTKRIIEKQYEGECFVVSEEGQTTFTITVAPQYLERMYNK